MPIIISRDGSAEPKSTNQLSAEQKRQLWEHIVLAYCQQNPDKLQAAAEAAAANT